MLTGATRGNLVIAQSLALPPEPALPRPPMPPLETLHPLGALPPLEALDPLHPLHPLGPLRDEEQTSGSDSGLPWTTTCRLRPPWTHGNRGLPVSPPSSKPNPRASPPPPTAGSSIPLAPSTAPRTKAPAYRQADPSSRHPYRYDVRTSARPWTPPSVRQRSDPRFQSGSRPSQLRPCHTDQQTVSHDAIRAHR